MNNNECDVQASPMRRELMSPTSADVAPRVQRGSGANPESLCRCVPCGECFYTPKQATDHFESAQHLREMQVRQNILASQPSSAINRFMRREPRVVRPLTPEEKLVHGKLLQPLLVCGDGEKFGDFVLRNGLFHISGADSGRQMTVDQDKRSWNSLVRGS